MKKSIVVDARMIAMSGIGRYIFKNLCYLSQEFNVILLIYQKDLEYARLLGCEYVIVSASLFSLSEQIEIFRVAPRCDLFWAPQFNLPWLIRLKFKKIVVTVCDVFPVVDKSKSVLYRLFARLFLNVACFVASKIVTISNFSKFEIFEQNFLDVEKKTHVIHCGYESNIVGDCLAVNCLKSQNPYFLVVGNVKPHKNLTLVIDAFKKFYSLNSKWKLVVVGKMTGFRTGYRDLDGFSNEPNIEFTGYVDDSELSKLYSGASCFIQASKYEGFGLTVLEAMDYELPVLLSDIPVFRELFEGQVDFFSVDDPLSLRDEMMRVSELKFNNRDYSVFLERFSWEASGHSHIELFRNLIEEALA